MAPDLLIIGGSGLLGSRLVVDSANRCLDLHATNLSNPAGRHGTWHRIDLADGGISAAALIGDLRPAAVVNAAYVQGGADLDAVTALAPGAMAAACAAIGARFVHVSSDVVFDGEKDGPYSENDHRAPLHPYGQAKLRAEQLIAAADPSAAVVRTSLLWSPDRDGGHLVGLVRDPSVEFFTDEIRSPIRVDRLSAAILELITRSDINGAIHLGGADAVDRLTLARALAPLANRLPAEIRGRAGHPDPARPRQLALDSGRAHALLRSPLPGIVDDRPT